MCEPASATYIMGAMMAAGTYMQQQAQEEAADRQQRAMNNALEQQDQYSRQAEQKGLENAQQYDPTKRTERFEAAREAAGDSLAQQLTQAREQAPSVSQARGRLSQAFEAESAKSAADQYQQSVDMARLMGRMRGAQDMMTAEGYTNADYASQQAIIGSNARGAARAAEFGIKAAGREDGGQMLAGGLMQQFGAMGLSSGLGKGMLTASGGAGAMKPTMAMNTTAAPIMFA